MATKVLNMKRTSVTPEEFVRVWQAGETVGEVATKLGMTKRAACQRAMYYRKKGVPMKKFPKGRHHSTHAIDYDSLATLAKSLS